MRKYRYYSEGITDQVFIADIIEIFYGFEFIKQFDNKSKKIHISFKSDLYDIEVIEIGGCSKLKEDVWKNKLLRNTETGGLNIVIFDADIKDFENSKSTGNNGISACRDKLNNLKKEVELDYYLWPNNQQDGTIENLLMRLIPTENLPIMECMKNYESCLGSIILPDITLRKASLKEYVNYYLYKVSSETHLHKRDYKNKQLWNLTIDDWLNNFRIFLDTYFK